MRNWSVLLLAVLLPSDVAKTKPGSGLTVTLDKRDGSVVFHNGGPGSVYLLKALDGSVEQMLMPYYRFTVRDPDGRPVKRKGRMCGFCGIWADTRWPQDYLVEIKPGSSYAVNRGWGWYFDFRREGPHTISFEYVYQPRKGDLDSPRMAWPRSVLNPPPKAWRGTVTAPDIVMDYKKR